MENHPIPQDVTGFQFKLIGDITVKQFAYLAGGTILGWIFFSLPIAFFIKFPLATLFFGTGLALAFLPIEGRPLDVMIVNFIKALLSPNQYIYQKEGGYLTISTHIQKAASSSKASLQKTQELQAYLSHSHQNPKNDLDRKEDAMLNSLFTGITNTALSPSLATAPVQPASKAHEEFSKPILMTQQIIDEPKITMPIEPREKVEKKEETIAEKSKKMEDQLQEEAATIKKEMEKAKESANDKGQTPKDIQEKLKLLEKQLNDTLSQKRQLEEQFATLAQQSIPKTQPDKVYAPSNKEDKQETPHVRKLPKTLAAKAGLPIVPDVPNLITGIIKDPRGNILPNILVEIKDKEGNPVRAFKTNNLGQFASATPLSNGVFTLEFEDTLGRNKFDAVELTVNGEIIPPLEIFSTDAREELRKELFG